MKAGRGRPPVRDLAAPVVLAGVTIWELSVNGSAGFSAPSWAVGGLLVGACAALVVRRTVPPAACVAASVLVAAHLLLQRDLAQQPAIGPFLVLLVAFFSLGSHATSRGLVVGGVVAGSVMATAEGVMLAAGRPPGDVLPSLLFWGAAAGAGRLVHRRHREARQAHEIARREVVERDRRVLEATAAERARIARELHDVVAHSLSVIVIQASVEARLQQDVDGGVARTLRTIEDTGREALADLRRLLGLLRAPDEAGALAPVPTLRDLEGLVEQVVAAGLDVRLEVVGEPRELPAGIDLSAYRITQEALTNACKHAPGSRVVVRVHYRDDEVGVEVEDDGGTTHPASRASGIPADLAGLGGGHGLAGMRERARLYDGRLHAGRRDPGGFGVRVTFPVRTEER